MVRNTGFRAGLSLAWMLSKQDIKNRYASSYAGTAWVIGVPLLYALINVMVFSVLMNGRMGLHYGDIPFVLFYFLPFSLWVFFSDMANRSPLVLREYAHLINKIAFPFWVLPLVPVLSALISQLIIATIFVLLMLYHGLPLAGSSWVYGLVWLAFLMLSLGLAYGVSALSVYVPDLAQIMPVLVNILFWITPVLYPATVVKEHGPQWVQALILDYNPFYYLVETARHAVFGTAEVAWMALGNVLALGLAVLLAGIWVFRSLRSGFADVL